MSKLYSGDDREAIDSPSQSRPTKRTHRLIAMKFDFIAKALSDPVNRGVTKKGMQGKRLTPFQGGVLTVLVNRVNPDRGYAFAGVRHVADLLETWPSTVGATIKRLVDQDILRHVGGGKKNRAQRLVPNWSKFIALSDYAFSDAVHDHEEDNAVHDHETDSTVHVHGETPVSMSMAKTKRNVGSKPKGKEPKRSGPYGPGGGPAKAGPPKPVGPDRKKDNSKPHSRKGSSRIRTGISRDTLPTKDGVLAHRNREAT